MNRRFKVAALALAATMAALWIGGAVRSITASTPRVLDIERLPVIVLDPGHGGIDGGAVSAGGVAEKDLNLDIALNLRDMLTACGFQVVMTREDDRSIHDEGVTGTKRQKTSDLKNRLEIVRQSSANAIFLCIHQNKFQNQSSHGAQMFYSPNHEDSRVLAEILQKNIVSMVQPENTRAAKQAEKSLFLMKEATCPAVLIECGFLSNAQDTKRLTDPEYRKQLSFAIMASVCSYLGMDVKEEFSDK